MILINNLWLYLEKLKMDTMSIVGLNRMCYKVGIMKKITITLNEEQERLLLERITKSTWRLSDTAITYLKKNYKNPSEWTKKQVAHAKASRAKLDKEHVEAKVFIDQIKKQLGKK